MDDRSPQNTNQIKLDHVSFKIYHQNVRSLRRKSQELLCHVYPVLSHVTCLTEHHLNIMGKSHVNIEGYTIAAQFCRVSYEKGGIVIYVHNSLTHSNTNFFTQKVISRSIYNLKIDTIYTGCPRRNVKYFGRVFLMLNYTDITQNTYIQS